MAFINDRTLEHTSRNGTRFTASRCDLSGGVVVEKPEGLGEVSLAQDIAEFTGWHALSIWSQLNGFAGYDCLQLDIRVVRDEEASGMSVREFAELVKDGIHPVVTFSKAVNETEGYLEAGMRGRIVSVRDDGDEVQEFKVDLSEFDAVNRLYESATYYDKNQRPCLTAREAGFYEPQISLWLMLDQPVPWLVEEAPRLSLHERFTREAADGNYLQWLEDLVLAPTAR